MPVKVSNKKRERQTPFSFFVRQSSLEQDTDFEADAILKDIQPLVVRTCTYLLVAVIILVIVGREVVDTVDEVVREVEPCKEAGCLVKGILNACANLQRGTEVAELFVREIEKTNDPIKECFIDLNLKPEIDWAMLKD